MYTYVNIFMNTHIYIYLGVVGNGGVGLGLLVLDSTNNGSTPGFPPQPLHARSPSHPSIPPLSTHTALLSTAPPPPLFTRPLFPCSLLTPFSQSSASRLDPLSSLSLLFDISVIRSLYVYHLYHHLSSTYGSYIVHANK